MYIARIAEKYKLFARGLFLGVFFCNDCCLHSPYETSKQTTFLLLQMIYLIVLISVLSLLYELQTKRGKNGTKYNVSMGSNIRL